MKICVPTMGNRGLDEQVGEHFGRVPSYTIFDTETNEATVVQNTSLHMGGMGYAPELISKTGATVMVCGGLGRRAVGLFEELGIMVYVGATGTVRDAVEMFNNGKLAPATDENACRQHAFRGEGIGNGHGHHH